MTGMNNIEQSLQGIMDEIHSMQSDTNNELTERNRNQVADLRQSLFQLKDQINEYRDQVVSKYRSHLGTNKEEFESLTPFVQQQSYPAAYELLQTYRALEEADQLTSQANGSLLSYSAGLEQQMIQKRNPPPITGEANYDNDPYRNNLSP